VRGIMNDFIGDFIETSITAEMTDDDIDRAIRMHEGDSLPGFPSPDTFEFLALPHLQKIAIPSVECVHNVASALDLLAQRMAQAVFRRFPQLAEVALEMTQNIIQREKDGCRIIVEQQISAHTGYLFTNDPSYLTEHGSMEPMYKQAQAKQAPVVEEAPKEPGAVEKAALQVKEKSQAGYQAVSSWVGKQDSPQRRQQRYSGPFVQEIRKRLDAYFFITVRNARDSIPKAIGFYLVRAVLDKLQFELLNELNQGAKINSLLGEPPHIMEERRALNAQLGVLTRASNVLARDPTLAAIQFDEEQEEEQQPKAAPRPAAAAPRQVQQAPAPAAQQQRPAPAQQQAAPMQQQQQRPAPGPAAPSAGMPPSAGKQQPAPLFGAPPPATKPGLFDDNSDTFGAKKPATKNPLFGDS